MIGGPLAAITIPTKLVHISTVPEVTLDLTPKASLSLPLLKPLPLGGGAVLIGKKKSQLSSTVHTSYWSSQVPNKVVTSTAVLKLCVIILSLVPLSQCLTTDTPPHAPVETSPRASVLGQTCTNNSEGTPAPAVVC